jgi:hypothetical protein
VEGHRVQRPSKLALPDQNSVVRFAGVCHQSRCVTCESVVYRTGADDQVDQAPSSTTPIARLEPAIASLVDNL